MSGESLNYFDEINSCKYLYLSEISEPEDNCLRVIIKEAAVGSKPEAAIYTGLLGSEIVATNESRAFEIYFDSYIGYSVVDESFALPDDSEVFCGRVFCVPRFGVDGFALMDKKELRKFGWSVIHFTNFSLVV